MNELIVALTRLANAAAVWLEENRQPSLLTEVERKEVEGQEVVATTPFEQTEGMKAKPKRHRRTRAEMMAEEQARLAEGAARRTEIKAAAEKVRTELSEEQSLEKLYTVAADYVRRFQNSTPDGRERARNTMKREYNCPNIKSLSHEQRVDFIAKMTTEIVEADKVPA